MASLPRQDDNLNQLYPVHVQEIRRVDDCGNLRAFAKVQVGPFVLHGCRVIQQPGQHPYAQLPMKPAGAGRKGWFPAVTCHIPTLDQQIKGAILEAYEAKYGGQTA
jgi:DNA-binding cell septation regulator SpoVG